MSNEIVNPVFVVTADQVRKAFDDAELRGERKQSIGVGELQSITISVRDQLGKAETLKLSILFLPPLDQARAAGYSFGRTAQGKTPEARKEIEDRAISIITANSNQVTFRVFLQQPNNDDAAIPSIRFQLTAKEGARIKPNVQPKSFVAPGKDLRGTVDLAQEGERLTFPLLIQNAPNLTASMAKFTLTVAIDGQEQSLEYALQ